jgi:glutamine amidotransferase
MPIEATASAPFSDGGWLLSHNGIVDRGVLPVSAAAESTVDSAMLAALIFDRGLDNLADTIVEVGAADPGARLNIVAANGSRLLGITWGDTLSMLRREDGVVLASEPYDDHPDWQDIPDRHLVDVSSGGQLTLTPLKGSS